ncbi:MAG: DNA ligase D [Polyangia bacterium]
MEKPLAEYNRKRDFHVTAEPSGRPGPALARGHSFVIQKHAATRLHYDFRLELDGVLKSWAVPKGPSFDPAVKRLAVQVEDHPLPYARFEGTIPKGEYGGGSVLVWDRGTWIPEGDPHEGLEKGRLRFELRGEKLHGTWNLVRGRSDGAGKAQWLLIKAHDDAARPESEYDVEAERPESVITGVTIDEVADRVDKKGRLTAEPLGGSAGATKTRARAARTPTAAKRSATGRAGKTAARQTAASQAAANRRRTSARADAPDAAADAGPAPVAARTAPGTDPLPEFVAPQLALLVSSPPTDPNYLCEIKFDGYRALARLDRRTDTPDVRIYTRSGNDWTDRFSLIAEALATLEVDSAYLDGEIVILGEDGRTDFQALQNAMDGQSGAGSDKLVYCVFDLLYLNGYDLRGLPLLSRKELLAELLRDHPHTRLRYSEHFTDPESFFKDACKKRLEGMVCKDGRKPYASARNSDWLKVKCTNRQEFILVGYTEPRASREYLGSLLLGAHDQSGRLRYVGRVGTGMNLSTLRDLKQSLSRLHTEAPPVYNPERGSGISWVEPRLVAEVEYGALTNEHMLRHAAFRGLRADKPASQVVLEVPDALLKDSDGTARKRWSSGRRKSATAVEPTPPAPRRAAREADEPRSQVVLSHPDKILYPPDGPTKQELSDYYEQVQDRMWPHVQNRPLALLRCPEGHQKQCFFQKHLHRAEPEPGINTVLLTEKNTERQYRYIESPLGLRSLVQLGVLEVHLWGSRTEDPDRPVELVFDLDPAPDVEWKRVVQATLAVRELLERLKLKNFLKLSGGKGVHLHVPIAPRYPFDQAKAFCRAVARQLEQDQPDLFTAALSKSERTGRIFLDYLRNGRGATFIAPFSARARSGAAIAVPVAWEDFSVRLRPDAYTVRTVKKYLKDYPKDPWAGYTKLQQPLTLLDEK